MANRSERLPENPSGKYYVDTTCIDCDLCRQTAPANFSRNTDKGYSYVSKQPVAAGQIKQCEQAIRECPVDSIGNDGES
ncbi:MAG TPA: ferredoxin [Candidatus Omnitrophota bacterium]|nr:ferredoxin [Candidatus Omnitrophota bacterium]